MTERSTLAPSLPDGFAGARPAQPRPIRAIRSLTRRLYVRGFPRLLWGARRLLAERDAAYEVTPGAYLWLDRDDYFYWMMVWGYYGQELRLIVERTLGPGDVFVDVGANVGFFSMIAAARVGASGRVLAIDADPRALAQLERNVRLNGRETITILPVAASDRAGTLRFTIAEQLGWSTAVADFPHRPAIDTVTVPARPLDEIVAEELPGGRAVRLVKIDVEGHEASVLRGARELIAARRTTFIVESNYLGLAAQGFTVADLVAPFAEHGYAVYWIGERHGFVSRPRVDLIPLTDPSAYREINGDILAVPPGARVP